MTLTKKLGAEFIGTFWLVRSNGGFFTHHLYSVL